MLSKNEFRMHIKLGESSPLEVKYILFDFYTTLWLLHIYLFIGVGPVQSNYLNFLRINSQYKIYISTICIYLTMYDAIDHTYVNYTITNIFVNLLKKLSLIDPISFINVSKSIETGFFTIDIQLIVQK